MQLSTKSDSSETWTRILHGFRPYAWTRTIWTRRRERSLGLVYTLLRVPVDGDHMSHQRHLKANQ
jgi:hypothetical protein